MNYPGDAELGFKSLYHIQNVYDKARMPNEMSRHKPYPKQTILGYNYHFHEILLVFRRKHVLEKIAVSCKKTCKFRLFHQSI